MLAAAGALKRIGAAGFLAVYLLGITGLSVYRHTCSMSNREMIAFYAGIYREAPGSCCEDDGEDQPGASFCGRDISFNATPCCRSVNTFLVLNVPTERQDRLTLPAISRVPAPVLLPAGMPLYYPEPVIHDIGCRYHSPPPYGKQLILYLHQIRIPALPDLA